MKTKHQLTAERVAYFRAQENYRNLIDSEYPCPPINVLYIEALNDAEHIALIDLIEELKEWEK